jgi:hypothetical protein
VAPAHAHLHRHDGSDRADSSDESPLLLTDIDRVLAESAEVDRAGTGSPVRVWRDDLTVALESLAYARGVLAADVGILRHTLATAPRDGQAIVDRLSAVVAAHPWGHGWSAPVTHDAPPSVDWAVCARSDKLMSTHDEIARTDLSSPEDVERVLHEVEDQLADLSRRQAAVEHRLNEVRAAIVRQYRDGDVPSEDWLG